MNQTQFKPGTLVYKITNPYMPPEYRQPRLESLVRKLMRVGLVSLVVDKAQHYDTPYQQVCFCSTPPEAMNLPWDGSHDDLEMTFDIKSDLNLLFWEEMIASLHDYIKRTGLTYFDYTRSKGGSLIRQRYHSDGRISLLNDEQLDCISEFETLTFSNKEP